MIELSADSYNWIKALHVIAVIAWMAGLLYLPRLFVYHAGTQPGSPQSELFKVMERRLLRAIMTPAMLASYLFGGILALAWFGGAAAGWLPAKLALVLVLTLLHHLMARWRKAFAEDRNIHSARFYRWWNEGPTVLMIVIVILVIVKPF